ncbi:MAG: hypothetical protein HYT37_00745 [Candidatus Sungbacteria bacterium]|nr:hypothetical protein [Candidatus Sungbacteria bacterium]
MNKKKINAIAGKIKVVADYLGNDIPRGREYYDEEPNCNIQWDSLRGYKDDILAITEHSVGTHIFDEGKAGFVVSESLKIVYRGKEVFSAHYEKATGGKPVYLGEIIYVQGRWESKLASLLKKAERGMRQEDKKRERSKK